MDTETCETDSTNNNDRNHIHGQCQPLAALGDQPVDAVVVGGIGAGALHKLNSAGIVTYRAVEGTVSENLKLFADGKLLKFEIQHTCAGHSKNGAYAH